MQHTLVYKSRPSDDTVNTMSELEWTTDYSGTGGYKGLTRARAYASPGEAYYSDDVTALFAEAREQYPVDTHQILTVLEWKDAVTGKTQWKGGQWSAGDEPEYYDPEYFYPDKDEEATEALTDFLMRSGMIDSVLFVVKPLGAMGADPFNDCLLSAIRSAQSSARAGKWTAATVKAALGTNTENIALQLVPTALSRATVPRASPPGRNERASEKNRAAQRLDQALCERHGQHNA